MVLTCTRLFDVRYSHLGKIYCDAGWVDAVAETAYTVHVSAVSLSLCLSQHTQARRRERGELSTARDSRAFDL